MSVEEAVQTLPPGMKKCATCGEPKLYSEFHFQRYAPRAGQRPADAPRERYRADCKVCHREHMKKNRIDKIKEKGPQYLEAESRRVRQFYDEKDRLELRRAVDRARYAAYAALREAHQNEYEELLRKAKAAEGVPDDHAN